MSEPVNTSGPSSPRAIFQSDITVLLTIGSAKLVIHLATNLAGGYGYFRDELYYIACSNHMAWGYVDQPPLSIAVLWFSRLFLGDSLFAIRFLPAVAGAVVVVLAGLMTRELGGKRYAQILASCAVIVAPLMLGMNSYFSMNSLDILFWTLALYLLIRILNNDDQKGWVLLGVVLGLGLLNKISVLWLGAGFGIGLISTGNRKLLLTRRVWLAAAIASLLFLPHILWQVLNGFPTLEFIRNATANKYVAAPPSAMFKEQVLSMNPLTCFIWLPGVIYFLVSKTVRRYRILPLIYLVVFLILVVNGSSKSEYLGPLFPMLFAMGAFSVEQFVLRYHWGWLKPVSLVLPVLGGIALAPFALPILPVESFIAYSRTLGVTPSTPEKKELSKLPQLYADMFGWKQMVASVVEAYNTLTPEEKAKCAIICNNYGEAGAIDFFGPQYALPKAISGHNNYWIWGPRGATGEVVIRLGGSMEAMKESYGDVTQAGTFHDEYCMPYENNMPVYVARHRRASITDEWAGWKHYE
jgi:hypothetical protein